MDNNFFASASAAPAPRRLALEFTGSGSEYFRIWIVNLLLIVVTLGIYYPWARVRKLRYFYANTLVGGDALGFHGNPKSMFRGYALMGGLGLAYSVASNFSPIAGLIALIALFAVGPALWRAGLQFRLSNTSWRGLRFSFAGGMADAYKTQLPVLVPLLGLILVGVVAGAMAAPGADGAAKPPGGALLVGLGLAPLVLIACSAYSFWRMKLYQHSHYRLGALQTRFTAVFGSFVKLFLKGIGLMFVVGFLVGIVGGMGAGVFGRGSGSGFLTVFLGLLVGLVVVAMLLATLKPWLVARLQNLVWNHTGNDELQFNSALKARSFIGLSFKNWLLIFFTLGFYWPFAAIAVARLRLEAMRIDLNIDPDSLSADRIGGKVGATGEAAGDLFGLDIGL